MKDLKRQIKQLESDLFLENLYIQEKQQNILNSIHGPKILGTFIVGTFITSFLITRKKSLPQAVSRVASLGFAASKLYTKFKSYLLFL